MPVWMIPIIMAAMGGAAGQAKGHNTASTLEGAGLGGLLGLGGAGVAGALGGTAAAGAGASADALGETAADSGALSAFGGTGGGASALDLSSISADPALAASGDAGDAAMIGGGAANGMTAADMGAIAGGVNPMAGAGAIGATPGAAFGAVSPGASITDAALAGSGNPTAWQSFLSNPAVQKGFSSANSAGWGTGMAALAQPQIKTNTLGQSLLGPMAAPSTGQPMTMPSYTQQMQALGFA